MIIDRIRERVKENSMGIDKEDLCIRGLWAVDCLFNPTANERIFNYKFIVAQTVGQGCAYSPVTEYDVNRLKRLIGKSYLDIDFEDLGLEIAVLDSIFSTNLKKPYIDMEIKGDSISKSKERAQMIVGSALSLVKNKTNPLISNVGVVGNFIKELVDRDINVVGTDFDSEIVGTKLFNKAEILHGSKTLEVVSESDVAIVTGMTLATETLDDIIKVAKANDTKLLIFAETGANLAEFYINEGVDMVVSEPFPFYIFQGKSTLRLFCNERINLKKII